MGKKARVIFCDLLYLFYFIYSFMQSMGTLNLGAHGWNGDGVLTLISQVNYYFPSFRVFSFTFYFSYTK
jgi:hypothetical protein